MEKIEWREIAWGFRDCKGNGVISCNADSVTQILRQIQELSFWSKAISLKEKRWYLRLQNWKIISWSYLWVKVKMCRDIWWQYPQKNKRHTCDKTVTCIFDESVTFSLCKLQTSKVWTDMHITGVRIILNGFCITQVEMILCFSFPWPSQKTTILDFRSIW